MITQNCDGHPLLALMHKPEVDKDGRVLPVNQQDKRAVVPLERADGANGCMAASTKPAP
jgi:hypothetical protein